MSESGWFSYFSLRSSRSSTCVNPLPVTVSVERPGSLLGWSWWCVITPSTSTSGTTPIRTPMITRLIGSSAPPASRP